MMRHLSNIPRQMEISIPPGEDGMIGRECPIADCLGYFKVKGGTGLTGPNLPCYCPYCGHGDSPQKFWTPEQIEYAKSVALNRITGDLIKDLKSLEFNRRPRGAFGIGFSMKVEGCPHPIRYFREKELETILICEHCSLHYAVYGVFAYCSDCKTHNSLQILKANLELAEKEIALALTQDSEMANYLIADALENAISAFDGFGREACRIRAAKASAPSKAESVSFQNLGGAQKNLLQLFGFDLAGGVQPHEWEFAQRCFQKRHLIAHRMGVIDEAYMKATNDLSALIGRKISIDASEVKSLTAILRQLGTYLIGQLP